MTDNGKIAEKIKEFRKAQKLTQKGFASALGVSRVTVANWETSQYTPDLITLLNIAYGGEYRDFANEIMKDAYGVQLIVMEDESDVSRV